MKDESIKKIEKFKDEVEKLPKNHQILLCKLLDIANNIIKILEASTPEIDD